MPLNEFIPIPHGEVEYFNASTSIEDLFSRLDAKTDEWFSETAWGNDKNGPLTKLCQNWKTASATDLELQKTAFFLQPDELEKLMKDRRLNVIEFLRDIYPEARLSILTYFSQRQKAQINILGQWVDRLDESGLLGLKKDEWQVFTTLSRASSSMDECYLKYDEYIHQLNGTSLDLSKQKPGEEYLYPIIENGRITRRVPFSDFFSNESGVLINEYQKVIDKLKHMDKKYSLLAENLEMFVSAIGSKETDPDLIEKQWSSLRKHQEEVYAAQLPFHILVQGNIDTYGVIQPEIRIGMTTAESKRQKAWLDSFKLPQTLVEIVQNRFPGFADKIISPNVFINFQPFSFGVNLSGACGAESDIGFVLIHGNETIRNFMSYMPVLERIFPDLFNNIDKAQLPDWSILIIALHELGHALIGTDINEVNDRLGYSEASQIVDEVKAETAGLLLFRETPSKNSVDLSGLTKIWFATAICFGYLLDRSPKPHSDGEKYFFTGTLVIATLFKNNSLKKHPEKYSLEDINASFNELLNIADKLLCFYVDPEMDDKKFALIGENIKTEGSQSEVLNFIMELAAAVYSKHQMVFIYSSLSQ